MGVPSQQQQQQQKVVYSVDCCSSQFALVVSHVLLEEEEEEKQHEEQTCEHDMHAREDMQGEEEGNHLTMVNDHDKKTPTVMSDKELLLQTANGDKREPSRHVLLETLPDSNHTVSTIVDCDDDDDDDENDDESVANAVAGETGGSFVTSRRDDSKDGTSAANATHIFHSSYQSDTASSSSSNAEAWQTLLESTRRLGQVLDDTTGISQLWKDLARSVEELQQSQHPQPKQSPPPRPDAAPRSGFFLYETALSMVGQWWTGQGDDCATTGHVGSATMTMTSRKQVDHDAIDEHSQTKCDAAKHRWQAYEEKHPVLQSTKETVQAWDKRHRLLQTTAERLAWGADFLTNALLSNRDTDGGDGTVASETERQRRRQSEKRERPGGTNV